MSKTATLEDPLFGIGTVVLADIEGEKSVLLIIGKRQVNAGTGNAWDYMSVPYPGGYNRLTEYVYFNHHDIYEVLAELPPFEVPDDTEEED